MKGFSSLFSLRPDVDNNQDFNAFAQRELEINDASVLLADNASNLSQTNQIVVDGTSGIVPAVNANTNSTVSTSTNDTLNNIITTRIASSMGFPIVFGDGRDGDLTVSTSVQIDNTKQYRNLTINNGGILTSNTQKTIFVAINGTLTLNSGGKISMAGKGSIGGTSVINSAGNIGSSGAGSGAGVDYLDFTTRAGASGAAGGGGASNGGNGGSGYSAGGTGGSGTGGNGVDVPLIIQNRAVLNQNILLTLWGAGGGSGGSNGGASGAGGAGGGAIYIECYNLVINENTNAIDTSGSNGLNGSGISGGGGGGSGGCIFIRYHTISNINGSNTNLKVNGGSGGSGGGGFASGGVGGNGLLFLQKI